MRNRFDSMSVKRKMRGRTVMFRIICMLAVVGIFSGVWLGQSANADLAPAVQLVRLNVTSEGGMVRIEITADGSLSNTLIEQHTRGREAVVRVRGARSLLRASYAVDETVARGVRIVSGESNGESFVDIVISMGEGATLAQRKNFNRLVIGIASDFAQLRRKSSQTAESSEQARRTSTTATRSVAVASAPVTDSVSSGQGTSYARLNPPAVNQTSSVIASPSTVNAQVKTAVTVAPVPVFRGRRIWSSFPDTQKQLARGNVSGFAPSFFNQPDSDSPPAQTDQTLSFFPMLLEAPGATHGVWVPGTTTSVSDEAGGRRFAEGILRPLFRFGAGFDDNFFYRSTEGRNVGVFMVAPRLEYEVPGDKSAVRLAYEARIRRLTNGNWANGHVFDFDSRFRLGSSFRLAVRDHFIRSALDPREYDPAGEVYIVGDTFTRNDAGLRFEYLTSPRGRVVLDLGYNLVRWNEKFIATAPVFLNYDEFSSSLSYERDISESTTAMVTGSFAYADTSVPLRPQFDGLNDRRRFAFELGARHQVTETSGLAFRIGFERSLFRDAPGVNNFSGLIFDLRFSSELTEKTKFELAALRKTQLSVFNLEGGNARLVSTGGSARLEQALADSVRMGLSLNYQQLGFPVAILGNSTASGGVFVGNFAGERRTEHLYGFGFDTTFDFSDLLRARLLYNFARRDSTIPVFTFNNNRASLIFEFGRRNDVKGRPF